MSVNSPNIDTLDEWAFDVRKVEKPWGHELIWALTDTYCGKLLFVRAGQSLSLQFHRQKDDGEVDLDPDFSAASQHLGPRRLLASRATDEGDGELYSFVALGTPHEHLQKPLRVRIRPQSTRSRHSYLPFQRAILACMGSYGMPGVLRAALNPHCW